MIHIIYIFQVASDRNASQFTGKGAFTPDTDYYFNITQSFIYMKIPPDLEVVEDQYINITYIESESEN